MEGILTDQKETFKFKNIKEEPLDSDVKHDFFDYQDQTYQNQSYNVGSEYCDESQNIWSFMVQRCRLLLQEEYGQMNSYLLTKLLIKESNEFLSDMTTFFKDCCVPISEEEINNENILEVDGLLVNCLPCHPKNLKCYYTICSDIPKVIEILGIRKT